MEDDVRKKGSLFLQQHRFGKRWRKVWCVLFRESHCSVSRLEIFDWNERCDRSARKQQDKKVIRLSSCIRVTPVDVEAAPKDTSSFLIETTEKIFVFAADSTQADEWTQRLCEIAFPMNWSDSALQRASSLRNTRSEPHLSQSPGAAACMEDNQLYSQRELVGVQDFRVAVRRTEASERCRLKGDALLRADDDALLLMDRGGQVLFTWPYRYLRRFGRDKSTFSFEAGRRCDSGEGNFEFDTKLGNALFFAVETAINHQRSFIPQRQASMGPDTHPPISRSLPPRPEELDPVYSLVNDSNMQLTHKDRDSSSPSQRPHLCRLEPPVDKALTAVKSLTLENRDPPLHRKNQVKPISSCPLPGDPAPSATNHPAAQTYSQIGANRKKKSKSHGSNGSFEASRSADSEYSLPFDLLIPDLRDLGVARSEQPLPADPLYDSIDEFQIRNVFHSDKPEHIYDEPEGCQNSGPGAGSSVAPVSLYDEPEEMRSEAWRIMGTEQDPRGHEFPYNPRADDYAVPKRAQRAFPEPQASPPGPEGAPDRDQGVDQEERPKDSPYNNLPAKMEDRL
uniref:Docking protein 2 n=1 Tax=Neogobius melanostomus TaxID=47308 RepID=A0A8C6SJ44_9GOBI